MGAAHSAPRSWPALCSISRARVTFPLALVDTAVHAEAQC